MKVMNEGRCSFRNRLTGMTVLWIAVFLCVAVGARAAGPRKVEGRLLVKAKSHVPEAQLQSLFSSHGAQEQGSIGPIKVRILSVAPARTDQVLDALQRNPNIEFAEQDYLLEPDTIPNDTHYPNEWHLPKIQAPQAWDISTGSSNIIIAIIDSGVDGTHPDLSPLLVAGRNIFDNNNDTSDVHGHGTSVAGAAAAIGNNGICVAGVAWGCKLMPIRVTDTNANGTLSRIASGLTWAADNGARVANLSFTVSLSPTVSSAAQYFQSKGGVVAAGAGNNGVFYADPDNPNMLTVSATDPDDVLATWSSTGNHIDLAAPGVGILTTARGGGYASASGTSFSTPIVAGVAALVLSASPSLSGPQVQDILKQSADDLGAPGWDSSYGFGRLRADKALIAATGGTNPPPDTVPPTASISAPGSGSIVSDVVTISILATDDIAITKVECYMNGVLSGTNSASPAAFSWDTSAYPNGSYTLQARAYDAAGNMGSSAFTTVTVDNHVSDVIPPTVQITSPANGTVAGRSVNVSVSASDNVGVTRVRLLVDGKVYASSTLASPVFVWKTSKLTRGSHFLQAVAFDAAGNSTKSAAVTVYK